MLYSKHMRSVALIFGCSLAQAAQSDASCSAILERHCVSCHGAARTSGLDLRNRETILNVGKRGTAVVPGRPAESSLFRAITHQGHLQMPPGKQALGTKNVATLSPPPTPGPARRHMEP